MSVNLELDIGTPENQLTMAGLRVFLRAYENPDNRRVKCSRQDFWAGYRAALIETRCFADFKVPPR